MNLDFVIVFKTIAYRGSITACLSSAGLRSWVLWSNLDPVFKKGADPDLNLVLQIWSDPENMV